MLIAWDIASFGSPNIPIPSFNSFGQKLSNFIHVLLYLMVQIWLKFIAFLNPFLRGQAINDGSQLCLESFSNNVSIKLFSQILEFEDFFGFEP